jgi:hypothetical protein
MSGLVTSAVLFVGPTLRGDDIESLTDCTVLPPASQGDLFRIAQTKPRAIGLIDGYFDAMPAVWHKEILWAMAQGIHIFGSASMGALRAAELHALGMVGVGEIFTAYRDGVLQDDDEVAVLHGPADSGFLPLSEAMVNVRATLARAEAGGVIARGSRERLEHLAKATFYQERTWPTLLAEGRAAGLPKDELAALETWLVGGRVDQKRRDALSMVDAMREFLSSDPELKSVDYHFEWTEMWDMVVGGTTAAGAAGDAGLSATGVLDELRLQGEPYRAWRRRALARLLGLREGRRRRLAADPAAVRALRDRLRRSHGLFARAELEAWVAANDLDSAAFERLLAEEALVEALAAAAGPDLEQQMLSELRLAGDYGALARRARQKAAALQAAGWGEDAPDGEGPAPATLLPWHFEQRLGRAVPDDLTAYARELGFASLADFHRALRREWLYASQR